MCLKKCTFCDAIEVTTDRCTLHWHQDGGPQSEWIATGGSALCYVKGAAATPPPTPGSTTPTAGAKESGESGLSDAGAGALAAALVVVTVAIAVVLYKGWLRPGRTKTGATDVTLSTLL
jgi:hypothetical protein